MIKLFHIVLLRISMILSHFLFLLLHCITIYFLTYSSKKIAFRFRISSRIVVKLLKSPLFQRVLHFLWERKNSLVSDQLVLNFHSRRSTTWQWFYCFVVGNRNSFLCMTFLIDPTKHMFIVAYFFYSFTFFISDSASMSTFWLFRLLETFLILLVSRACITCMINKRRIA